MLQLDAKPQKKRRKKVWEHPIYIVLMQASNLDTCIGILMEITNKYLLNVI